jgi:tellurite resistance protein TehA-like permease
VGAQGFSLFWGIFAFIELCESLWHHHRRTGHWADGYSLTWWSLVFPMGALPSPSPLLSADAAARTQPSTRPRSRTWAWR